MRNIFLGKMFKSQLSIYFEFLFLSVEQFNEKRKKRKHFFYTHIMVHKHQFNTQNDQLRLSAVVTASGFILLMLCYMCRPKPFIGVHDLEGLNKYISKLL